MTNFIGSQNQILTEAQSLTNAQALANIAVNWGWSKNAIAALCGNSRVESYVNPNMWQNQYADPANGYGLFQWTPATKLISWAAGQDYTTGETQMARLKYEIENGIQYYPTASYPETFQQFSVSTKSVDYLTRAFVTNYERPANIAESIDRRIAFANLCISSLDWSGAGGTAVIHPLLPVTYGTPLTSPFGYRDIGIGTNDHLGTDWGGSSGDPIFATMSGVVVKAQYDSSRGNYVIVKHTHDQYYSTYQHLLSDSVSVGDNVAQGQTIAAMGTTGDSTGVHLHFAISTTPYGSYADDGNAGVFIDPEIYLQSEIVIGGGGEPDPRPNDKLVDFTTPQTYTTQEGIKMSLYTVKDGDTLGAIAKSYGVPMNNIKRMQPVAITNQNLIMSGDILAIPVRSIPPRENIYYMIKPGDTLSAIAKKYGVGISDIMKLNAITNPNKIQAGKLIKIK